MRRFLALHAVAAIAMVLALGVAQPAGAHWSPGWYTHTDSNCANNYNRIDPVSMIFYNNATPDRVGFHITYHTGWGGTDAGGQWFKTHDSPNVCVFNGSGWQRASSCGTCDRYHIRYADVYEWDGAYGWAVIGTPHYETYNYGPNCWGQHAVTSTSPGGFVNARNTLYNALRNGGHAGTMGWIGNTEPRKQCDNEYVANDGYGAYVMVTVNGS
jgi:hypothetical protein